MRRDEEQDFAILSRDKLALKKISKDWNRTETRSLLASCAFGVGQHTTHHGRATIWHQHFSLHALSVDAGDATNGDAGIDCVVFDRHTKNDRTHICNLRSD